MIFHTGCISLCVFFVLLGVGVIFKIDHKLYNKALFFTLAIGLFLVGFSGLISIVVSGWAVMP